MKRQKPITNWDEVPVYVDLPMAARILGKKSPEYLKQLCQKGKFPGFKVGKEWRVAKEDLMALSKRPEPPMALEIGA